MQHWRPVFYCLWPSLVYWGPLWWWGSPSVQVTKLLIVGSGWASSCPVGICDILSFPVSLAENLEPDLADECAIQQADFVFHLGRQCHMSNVGKGCLWCAAQGNPMCNSFSFHELYYNNAQKPIQEPAAILKDITITFIMGWTGCHLLSTLL